VLAIFGCLSPAESVESSSGGLRRRLELSAATKRAVLVHWGIAVPAVTVTLLE